MTYAGWTLVSRITGFLRVAVIASIFGPTFFGNLYQSTYVISSTIHELLIGSMIPLLLVPPLARHVARRDPKAASQLAGGFLGVVVLVFSAATVVIAVGGPIILHLLSIGVADPDVASAFRRLGWPLLAIMAPQVVLYGVAATGLAIQQAHKRFALGAAAPALENLGVIAILVASVAVYGRGFELNAVTYDHIWFLGIGTTSAVGLHALAQWWGARRLGISMRPRLGWNDEQVRSIMRLSVPSLGISALTSLQYFAILVVAGSVAGGVIAFQMGWLLLLTIVSISAKPVAAAQLPRLSRWSNERRLDNFGNEYREGMSLGLFAALPASFVTLAASGVLASVMAFGEMSSPVGVRMVTASIAALALGIVGRAGLEIARSASFARRDAVSPLWAAALRLAVVLPVMLAALIWTDGAALILTLGVGVTAGEIVSGYYLHRRVIAGLPAANGHWLGEAVGTLMSAAIASLPAVVLAFGIKQLTSSRAGEIAAVSATVLVVLVAYLAMQHQRRSPALANLVSAVGQSRVEAAAMDPPRTSRSPATNRGKRLADLVIAGLGITLVAPAMVLVSLAVRLTSRGPVIFRQQRIGLNGSPFVVYKFRTMLHGTDDRIHREYTTELLQRADAGSGTVDGVYKLDGDPRITPVGRFLRRYSLDELPQLFNVLAGSMSIVGPRPALPHEVELYESIHRQRLHAKPGLTGLWQVSGRNKLNMLEMLELDVRYVAGWTPSLDMLILIKTLPAVLRGDGAR